MNPLSFLLICLAGWMNRHQQVVVEYIQQEIRVLQEQLGKRPRFNDDQRRRLTSLQEQACRPKRAPALRQHRNSGHLAGVASAVDRQKVRLKHQAKIESAFGGSRHSRTGSKNSA